MLLLGKLKVYVEKIFEYDASNERLPVVSCSSCKRNLYIIKKDTENKAKLQLFSDLESLKKITRLSNKS